jgi:uncharacterized Rmd1/YagE family protein
MNRKSYQRREDYAYSDSETAYPSTNFFGSSGVRFAKDGGKQYNLIDGNSDEDPVERSPNDEFGDNRDYSHRIARTGRQRKKLAARSKGGEFQTRRRKRRVYFCCVSSDIDVQKLFDYLVGAGGGRHGWKYQLYNDVLHLYKAGVEEGGNNAMIPVDNSPRFQGSTSTASAPPTIYYDTEPTHESHSPPTVSSLPARLGGPSLNVQGDDNTFPVASQPAETDNPFRISGIGAQEVFVFDFGAVVFWGFSRGEETNLLKTVRMFVTRGNVGVQEFQYGEDDMAFFTSPETKTISLANDVISLPEDSVAKQRLSISFAIAQSSVLAIFEARIDRKIEEYKYIPETLAAYGKIHLTERQLGMMIGEVFVIRHDVNLHTEILGAASIFSKSKSYLYKSAWPHYYCHLNQSCSHFHKLFCILIALVWSDTPDFFWKQEQFEQDYKMVRTITMMGNAFIY